MLLCKIFGHKWRYKDYTQAQNRYGKKYNFTATRICIRCDKKDYKFAEWIDESLVPKIEID
ncbi:MAG TPA: DUF1660 family phage protein [Bacteroidia bacterium]|nr:DUF1660 family phage protein [Bacteroidia bacterium]